MVTGEPQFVLIRNSAGEGGHAMVVYKVNFNEGKLYIADPNYPNNRVAGDGSESIRTIDYVGGVLKPYETGLTAGENSTTMDQIGYFGKTAYIDWGQMAIRWVEVENKTIGNDRFPTYQLKIQNDNDKELADQYNIDKDTLKIYCKSTASEEWLPNTDHYQPLDIYNDQGVFIVGAGNNNGGVASVPLKPGLNKLGFYIMCGKNGKGRYTDFKWINIVYSILEIDPNPIVGKPNEDITITALSNGSAPSNAKYVWNFGDQTSEVTKNNDSVVTHQFVNEGEYQVEVKLYDNSDNKLVGTANATANIAKEGELLVVLHTMTNFGVGCSFNFITPQGSEYSQGISFFKYDNDTLKWNGASFNYDDVDEEDFDSQGFKTNYYHYVSGTVSSDGRTILEIRTKYVAIYYRYYELYETHTEEMNFINVPIIYYPGYQDWGGEYDSFLYQLEEDAAVTHVSLVKWTWEEKDETPVVYSNIKDFWQPMTISFSKD